MAFKICFLMIFTLLQWQVFAAAAAQDVTHADLIGLRSAYRLTPDALYRITDYRTRHRIPNTAEVNIGEPETLIVRALSSGELSSLAFSEKYPQDVIYYELVDSSTQGGDKGRIVKRIDPLSNISSFEDWRNVKYRRWNTQKDGKGTYTAFTDNGNPSADYYPICGSSAPDADCYSIDIGRPASDVPDNLPNIIIGKGARDIVIGPYVEKVTIGTGSNEVYLAGTLTEITIGLNCHQIRIGLCSDYVMIGDRAYSITIGNSSSHTHIQSGAHNIYIGDFSPSTANNGFRIGDAISAPNAVTILPNVKGTDNPIVTGSNILLMPEAAYVGNGIADAVPVPGTIRGTGGTGVDMAGAQLTIAGGSGTGQAAGGSLAFATAPSGSAGATPNAHVTWLALDSAGHLSTAVAGQEPVLSNCGASATIAKGSTDTAGTFVIGESGAVCTMTFRRAYRNVPACIVTAETSSNLISFTKSASAITVKGRSGTFNYICYGLNE